MNKRGQLTIYGLLNGLLMIIYFVAVLPIIVDMIATANPQLSSMERTLMALIPMVFIIVIIQSITLWGQPSFGYGGR